MIGRMGISSLERPERTFCGVSFAGDAEAPHDADVVIVGASHGTPYRPGIPSHAADAPRALRAPLDWYSADPAQLDFDSMTRVFGGASVVDAGDVGCSADDDGTRNRTAIRAAVEAVISAGAVPLVLGGDDSVPIAALEAFSSRAPLTVLQVDAHIDWRDEVDGVRHGFSSTMRRASEMAHVTRIVQIGARGPGSARPTEYADAQRWGASIVTAREVHHHGLEPALGHVPHGGDVYLAIDVDGIDPSVVPGVILPAHGGLDYQQMLDIIHGVAARGRLAGASFVEYVPSRDPTGNGARAIARLASNLIAAVGRQRSRLP